MIVATGVYALLLRFLQKNSPHNVQTNGGGVRGFLNNVKKTAFFLHDGFPKCLFTLIIGHCQPFPCDPEEILLWQKRTFSTSGFPFWCFFLRAH